MVFGNIFSDGRELKIKHQYCVHVSILGFHFEVGHQLVNMVFEQTCREVTWNCGDVEVCLNTFRSGVVIVFRGLRYTICRVLHE